MYVPDDARVDMRSTAENIGSHVVKVKKQRLKRVRFHALRSIKAGEELVWNYGEQYWRHDRHKIVL